ncbi:T9SS type A sorting domain-containing protein [Bacteroides salyersiae]|nr:T9SS type A sorting domain-containing protein [Bacteroides salyersiae]
MVEYYEDYTVDLSGASSIQNIQSDSFVVYPNPTEGELSVNLEDASEYMLYSIDGRLVQKGIVDRNVIDVTGNASGMYILKVKSGAEIKCANIIIK